MIRQQMMQRLALAGAIALGSAKSNIGHTETAAGVAGLIKAVLMLQHGTIVPTLHAATPSARIAWSGTPFRLATETRPWTERLVAGVSSFGIGGTNAHIVLGRAPEASGRLTASRLLVSARDHAALGALTAAYGTMLADHPFAAVAGACTTCHPAGRATPSGNCASSARTSCRHSTSAEVAASHSTKPFFAAARSPLTFTEVTVSTTARYRHTGGCPNPAHRRENPTTP